MPDPNTAWRCKVCGYIHRGAERPESCPVCGAPREDFEPIQAASEPPAAETSPPPGTPANVVIIGAGGAGIAAAKSLRKHAPATQIILISEEPELPYYRLKLTRYLAGEIGREDLFIYPDSWYRERDIELLLGTEVSRLNPEENVVELADGTRVPFGKLLLASGAHPFIPPIPGANRAGVTSLRTIQDVDYVLASCREGARCVCIGGGILGLETAGGLARQGAEVTLLEKHDWLMPRQLNPQAGELMGDHINRLGIKLLRKAETQEIVGEDAVQGVVLKDGRSIPADLVIIATGIRANHALAEEAGLNVKRGVVVDNYLRTSNRDILAAGDVAEHDEMIHGLWAVSQAQGTIAGMNLAGTPSEFGGVPPFTTIKVLGIKFASIGQIMPKDERDQVLDLAEQGRYFCFVFRENYLVGTILLGDTSIMSPAKQAIESQRDCSDLLQGRPDAAACIEYFKKSKKNQKSKPPKGSAKSTGSAGKTPPTTPPAESSTQDKLMSYRCPTCGYVYDEAKEEQSWSELPEDWICPVCGAAQSAFESLLGPEPEKPASSSLGTVVQAHRVFGYVFLAVYLLLMWQMVPRLWTYQIEFPSRTVFHMSLGMAIGVILLLKISIVRFFKRLDPPLVPAMGTSLLVASVVLIGIAVPPAFREAIATSRLFEMENRQRVHELLSQTGMDQDQSESLATRTSLRAGQQVLRQRCVQCHDLRTVLAQPRTPAGWRQTVRRMAGRTTLLNPLTEQQQWQVTAYLVALSPQLQRSLRQLREQQEQREETRQAAAEVATGRNEEPAASYNHALAKQLFETKCSECHDPALVAQIPPDSRKAAHDLVKRMVKEGLTASEEELSQIVLYLIKTYVNTAEP